MEQVQNKQDLQFVEQGDLEPLEPVILRRKLWAFIDRAKGAMRNPSASREIETSRSAGCLSEEIETVHRKHECVVDPVSGKPKAVVVTTKSFRARRRFQQGGGALQNRVFSSSSPALLSNALTSSPIENIPPQTVDRFNSASPSVKRPLMIRDGPGPTRAPLQLMDGRPRPSTGGSRHHRDPIRAVKGAGDVMG